MSRRAAVIVVFLVATAACSDDAVAATTRPEPAGRSPTTLLGIPAVVPDDAVACAPDLPLGDWEIDAAVLLPGFALPDGDTQPPATYRLLLQRGSEDGYESITEAATAATDWLPAEFQPTIRSIVLNRLGRNYVFEAEVAAPGPMPGGGSTPCLLPAASAQIVVWYSLQVLDPLGTAEVIWVWQQQGRPIQIEPYE